jgi:hypothetical protein
MKMIISYYEDANNEGGLKEEFDLGYYSMDFFKTWNLIHPFKVVEFKVVLK